MSTDTREELAALRYALERADQFITNGIALGFIRMPDKDCPDTAHETPGIIRAALATQPAQPSLAGLPFAEVKARIESLNEADAKGLAISLLIQNGIMEKYAAQPSAQGEAVAAPKGCYPEEWGPSSNRRLTCACGNPDPLHWEMKK